MFIILSFFLYIKRYTKYLFFDTMQCCALIIVLFFGLVFSININLLFIERNHPGTVFVNNFHNEFWLGDEKSSAELVDAPLNHIHTSS